MEPKMMTHEYVLNNIKIIRREISFLHDAVHAIAALAETGEYPGKATLEGLSMYLGRMNMDLGNWQMEIEEMEKNDKQ